MKRDSLRKRRLAAHYRQGGVCFWCGRKIRPHFSARPVYTGQSYSTAEHLVPRVRKGGHGFGNIVSACVKCNNSRGHMPIVMWLAILPERLEAMGTAHHFEVLLSWLRARGISAHQVGHPGNGPDAKRPAASPPPMDISPAP